MNKSVMPAVFCLVFSLVAAEVSADLKFINHYTNKNHVQDLAVEGDYVWAATKGGVAKTDQNGIITESYCDRDGLVHNVVNAVETDRSGNVWFGTRSGVSKFDGFAWTTFTDADGLIGDWIHDIKADDEGNIWFCTSDGVSKFDGAAWTAYTMSDGLAANYVRSVVIDGTGNKWFGTHAGVSKFDGVSWTTYTASDGLADNSVNAIAADSEGKIWFGTDGGISEFDGVSWTNHGTTPGTPIAYREVRSIAVDGLGNKWFATMRGVLKYDGVIWTDLDAGGCAAIEIDSNGNAWVAHGAYVGVSKFDGATWTTFILELIGNRVSDIEFDNKGNTWFATDDGLSKFDGMSWTAFKNLLGGYITAVAAEENGNIWIGAVSGKVSKFDGVSWTDYTIADQIFAIATDSGGSVWFGTNMGAMKFDGVSWTVYTVEDGLANNFVRDIAIDGNGNVWFGTGTKCGQGSCGRPCVVGGVSKYDGVSWTTHTKSDGLFCGSVSAIAADENGDIWAAGWDYYNYSYPSTSHSHRFMCGISKFDGISWTTLREIEYPYSEIYNDLAIDGDGNTWIGANRVLLEFNGTSWKIHDGNTGTIRINPDGNIWLGHAHGVSVAVFYENTGMADAIAVLRVLCGLNGGLGDLVDVETQDIPAKQWR